MHLLIAGLGYLGRELAERAAAQGHHLTTWNRSGQCATHAVDLTDPETPRKLADTLPPVDTIIHCASSSRGDAEVYRQVYQRGLQNLAQSFPQTHLLFVSSTSVYGQKKGEVVTEDAPTQPKTATSQVLLEAESHAHTVARLAGLYGPGRCHLLKTFLAGQATLPAAQTNQVLNLIHRDDAAEALLLLAQQRPGGVWNVCDDAALTKGEIYTALSQEFGLPFPPDRAPTQASKRALTHKKVTSPRLRALGWQPRHCSLIQALPKLRRSLEEFPL